MAGLFTPSAITDVRGAAEKPATRCWPGLMQSTPVRVHADTSGGACDFGLQAAMVGSHAGLRRRCVQAKKFLVGINFNTPRRCRPDHYERGGATVNGFDRALREGLERA